jgi:hypothetical protein
MVSPLRGADGNVEFLAHLRIGSAADRAADPMGLIDVAVLAGSDPADQRAEPES